MKPDDSAGISPPYGYNGDPEATPLENGFTKLGQIGYDHHPISGRVPLHLGDATDVKDRYEIMAFAAEARCRALGTTKNTAGFRASQSLQGMWLYDPFGKHQYELRPWHSAQFLFSNMEQKGYWSTLMRQFGFSPNL